MNSIRPHKWPVGTKFRLATDEGEQLFTIMELGFPEDGTISTGSKVGAFLQHAVPEDTLSFGPSNKPYVYVVKEIIPPSDYPPDFAQILIEISQRISEGRLVDQTQEQWLREHGQNEALRLLAERRKAEQLAHEARKVAERIAELTDIVLSGSDLQPEEREWLERVGPDGGYRVLAIYFEKLYERQQQLGYLAAAGKWLRRQQQPQRTLEITDHALDAANEANDPVGLAMILTVRAAALRDLRRLEDGRHEAERAVNLSPSDYHPHNVLGALYYDQGNFEAGDRHFRRARELGSTTSERAVIAEVVEGMDDIKLRRMALEHLRRNRPDVFSLIKGETQ